MGLIEEFLPLAELSIELGTTLSHEIEALLFELMNSLFVYFVHDFDVVDDFDFVDHTSRLRLQELALCHALISR